MRTILFFISTAFAISGNAQLELYFDSTSSSYGFKKCEIFEPMFDEVYELDGSFLVTSDGLTGWMDEVGNLVVMPEFIYAVPHNGSARIFFFDSTKNCYVFDRLKKNFVDTMELVELGDLLIDGGESYISGNELFRVVENGLMRLYNLNQGVVYDLKTEYLNYLFGNTSKEKPFSLLVAGSYGSLQILNLNGKPFSKEVINDFFGVFNGAAIVLSQNQVKFIDLETGKLVGKPKDFKSAYYKNTIGDWGVIGADGLIKIPFEFTSIRDYSKGFYLVDKNRFFYGLMDESGNQYLSNEDLKYQWMFVYCNKFDFFKDAHRAYDGSHGDAAFFYDKNLNKLVRKTEFEYFSVDCNSNEKGKYLLLKGDAMAPIEVLIDSNGNLEN